MGDFGKAIQCRLFKRTIDQQTVVVLERSVVETSEDTLELTANKCYKPLVQLLGQLVNRNIPKDITPTAWKKPELTKRILLISPRDSEGTRNP